MRGSLSLVAVMFLFTAFSAGQQTTDPNAPRAAKPQDSAPAGEAKKPKKVLTNEDLSKSRGKISVVGDPQAKPRPVPAPRTAPPQYIAAVRNQLEKLQEQISDLDKQITDLKNFKSGEPSTGASGIRLDKRYEREPVEVQIRALKDKKKNLERKADALYDEARKRGVASGELP